jgi:hypothetical protein
MASQHAEEQKAAEEQRLLSSDKFLWQWRYGSIWINMDQYGSISINMVYTIHVIYNQNQSETRKSRYASGDLLFPEVHLKLAVVSRAPR